MKHGFSCYKRMAAMILSSLLCVAVHAQTPGATPSKRIPGQIVSLDGTDLQMRADTGQTLKVKLTSGYRVGALSRGDLSKITAGAYIGVAAMPQPDGTLKAVDLRVFPESMRGTGEGHRPMNEAGGTMTNATVSTTDSGETMTNATVGATTMSGAVRKITVKYNTGEKVVLLQPDTPVFMIETGKRDMLVSGARVVVTVTTQPDGSLSGDRVTVGLNGAIPPL